MSYHDFNSKKIQVIDLDRAIRACHVGIKSCNTVPRKSVSAFISAEGIFLLNSNSKIGGIFFVNFPIKNQSGKFVNMLKIIKSL